MCEGCLNVCPCLKVRTTRTQVANLSFSVGVVAITLLGALTLDFGWRFLAFMTAIPPTVALVMAFYISESPTWLADVGEDSAYGQTSSALRTHSMISYLNVFLWLCSKQNGVCLCFILFV